MSAEPDDLASDIGDALANVLSKHERSITTRWVALIETIDEDGERGLWTLVNAGAKAWDALGMMTHAIHLEQARTMRLAGD